MDRLGRARGQNTRASSSSFPLRSLAVKLALVFGPSLMPSGDPYAWTRIEPIWKAIAAKVDPKTKFAH